MNMYWDKDIDVNKLVCANQDMQNKENCQSILEDDDVVDADDEGIVALQQELSIGR